MTIEMSPSQAAVHGARDNAAASARQRAGAKDDANAPDSFEHALSAADEKPADKDDAEAAAPEGTARARNHAKTASSDDRDAHARTDRDAAADAGPASSSSGNAAGDAAGHGPGRHEAPPSPPAVDNALLLAQSALSAGVPPATSSDPASAGAHGAAGASALMPIGRAVPRGPVSVQALGTVPGRADAAAGMPDLSAGAAAKALPAGAAASKAAAAANARAADAQPAASACASAAQPATPQIASPDAAQQAVAAPMSEGGAQQAAAMPEALLRRPDERKPASDTPPGAPSGSGTGATTLGSALMAPVDPSSAAASAGHSMLTDRMLEQVSWWLSQKTQGAELTLDVARGHSVSVSVQVQGNETHVAFRSDQPEVRQMLGQAMPQLKEMLGHEGLMLSGSSVGSHADNAGQHAAREGARPWRIGGEAVSAAAAPAVAPVARPRAPSGRSLDLYV